MDPADFFAASRVIIVAGKGGVGKTTVTAALAGAAARTGLSTLVIEVEGKSGLADLYGQEPFDYHEVTLSPGGGPDGSAPVRARTLTPDDALIEYLEDHGMSRISKRLITTGAVDIVATAAPGIKDILVLGKVKQLERSGMYDLIVLDAPAAGHAISFLRSARGLMEAVRTGPINTQATDVLEMLSDPSRCQVVLVTLPEETPVNELVDTAFSLEDEIGVSLGPVVVNGLYPELPRLRMDRLDVDPPDLDPPGLDPVAAGRSVGTRRHHDEQAALRAAAQFRLERTALQREQVTRLADMLPLPQIHLPYLFSADLSPRDLDLLITSLDDGVRELPAL